jgi:hypothetical protein
MKYILVLLYSLEILDGIFTRWAVTGGLARELNPVMYRLAGDWNFLLLKVIGAILSALALWHLYKRFSKMAITSAACIVIFYSLVLTWNFSMLLGH